MKATKELNELFHRWEKEIPEYQGKFIKDGINNEEVFNKQKGELR